MRHITLALHCYHQDYGSFPPAYVTDSTGKPLYSWRVLILPYLDRQDIYQAFRLDEAWDSPNNLALATSIPYEFNGSGLTSYVALVGPQSMWPDSRACKITEITDGVANTIMVVEWPESDIVWSEPRDLPVVHLPLLTKPAKKVLQSRPKAARDGSIVVGMADGSSEVVRMPKLSPRTVQALISRGGGEKIKPEDWKP